jgi:hypothetical protein
MKSSYLQIQPIKPLRKLRVESIPYPSKKRKRLIPQNGISLLHVSSSQRHQLRKQIFFTVSQQKLQIIFFLPINDAPYDSCFQYQTKAKLNH